MRICENGVFRDANEAEEQQWIATAEAVALEMQTRHFTEGEALRFLLERLLNTLEVEDALALRLLEFYPAWQPGVAYPEGFLTRYEGALWRSLLGHTSDETTFPQLPGLSRQVQLWEQVN